MFTNIFGRFLTDKGLLTIEQFEDVKSSMRELRVRLGTIAVAQKMMSPEEADMINRKQIMLDKRFGTIAEELGILSREQVNKLLHMQGNPYIAFSQCVTDKGYMTFEQVEAALKDFQTERGFSDMDMEGFKQDDPDRIIPMLLPGELDWNAAELIGVVIRSMCRLVSTDVYMADGYFKKGYDLRVQASQRIFGQYNALVALCGPNDGMLSVASDFAKFTFGELDMEALDSITEFINIADGLFATQISLDGIDTCMEPPSLYLESGKIISDVVVIPLEVDGNEIDLVVTVNK